MKLSISIWICLSLFSATIFAQLGLLPDAFARRMGRGLLRDMKLALQGITSRSTTKTKKELVKRDSKQQPLKAGKHCVAVQHEGLTPYVIPPWIWNTSSIINHPTSTRSVSQSTTKGAVSTSTTIIPTAGTTTSAGSTSQPQPSPSATVAPSPWKVQTSMSGSAFFDDWDFWDKNDPTDGTVTYTNRGTAQSNGLISINDAGHAIMRVETTPNVPSGRNRMSVRIESKVSFTGGLLIADIIHMPHGCGTWPAWWTNGPPVWPFNGEIDILEGVHEQTINMASVHTKPGCTVPANFGASAQSSVTDPGIGLVCDAIATANIGCGQYFAESNTYGAPFNNNGGGVYAMLWDDSGISIYFWPRGAIPDDISSSAPQPKSWREPSARWPASQCNPYEYFRDHSTIFDTTLCGQWAGLPTSWNAGGLAGQGQSCAASTGVQTCEAFVRNNGAAFNDAYWEVKSVTLYQSS